MSERAKAAVTPASGRPFVVTDVDVDEPRPTEVLVRIEATGTCHTDVIARDGWHEPPFPVILGHEGAGFVERVGPGVRKVARAIV